MEQIKINKDRKTEIDVYKKGFSVAPRPYTPTAYFFLAISDHTFGW